MHITQCSETRYHGSWKRLINFIRRPCLPNILCMHKTNYEENTDISKILIKIDLTWRFIWYQRLWQRFSSSLPMFSCQYHPRLRSLWSFSERYDQLFVQIYLYATSLFKMISYSWLMLVAKAHQFLVVRDSGYEVSQLVIVHHPRSNLISFHSKAFYLLQGLYTSWYWPTSL